MTTYSATGKNTMRSTSSRSNIYTSNGTDNFSNGKPQFGGCALVVALLGVFALIVIVISHM